MQWIFSEFRRLWEDVLSIIRSPDKIKSLLRVPLYSNSIYMVLADAVGAIFGFVFWVVASRLYSTEAVGVCSALISAIGLLQLITTLGLGYGLIRFLKSSDDPVKLINSVFTIIAMLALVAAGIFILGLGIWSPSLKIVRETPFYMLVFLLAVPILVLDDSTDKTMMGGRQAKFIFIHNLIYPILKLALLVALATLFRSFGIFIASTAAMFVALSVSLFFLVPRTQLGYHPYFTVGKKEISKIMGFSIFNYLGDLFWNVPGVLLPLIVINQLGASMNAYFYMAWALGSILTLIPSVVAMALLAEGAFDETQLKNHVRRGLRIMMLLLVPSIVLVWLLANKLLMLYGGLYAQNATTLLRWLAVAALPFGINSIYFGVKRVQKDVKPIIVLAGSAAAITILSSYLLIPKLGISGVGIAWLFAQSVIALVVIPRDIARWLAGN